MKIGIIGGGPAGMSAAIIAALRGHQITILEHMPRIGKKLLLTGSGKCNISNLNISADNYHGDAGYVNQLFEKCPPEEVLDFIRANGIELKDRNGYLYPNSEQASAVLDCLRFSLRDNGIETIADTNIKHINVANKNNPEKFEIVTDNKKYFFDKIILCCGAMSYKNTGSDGSGYEYAKAFGHNIIKPLPALTFFNCEESFYPSIAGIRTKAKVTLCADNKIELEKPSEKGELQITKTGISGIPVFNLSYQVSRLLDREIKVRAYIDFLTDYERNDLFDLLKQRVSNSPKRTLEEMFIGLLHKNIGLCILKRIGYKPTNLCETLDDSQIYSIIDMLKSFETSIVSTGSFDNSQVTTGGVDTSQVNCNMESLKCPGLYFAGEILNVNGDCGGYNLHFAIMSGIIAGRSI